MEILISTILYILVFGTAAVLAVLPAVAAYFLSPKRIGKGWSYFAGLVIVLCVLAGLSQKPILFYTRACTQNLSAQQEQQLRSVSGGAYSLRAPLVSVLILVEETGDDRMAWTEYYFPIGNRKLELSGDGFNCTKYLFPW